MSYAGDVSPTHAFEAVRDDPAAVIVDVRTRAELAYVGFPDLFLAMTLKVAARILFRVCSPRGRDPRFSRSTTPEDFIT